MLAIAASPALAEDVALCFATADRVAAGEAVDETAKKEGHDACRNTICKRPISTASGAHRNSERKSKAANRAEPDPPRVGDVSGTLFLGGRGRACRAAVGLEGFLLVAVAVLDDFRGPARVPF